MARTRTQNWLVTVMMVVVGLIGLAATTGCDEYVEAGDFYGTTVEPADFSPYGYDYDMYDLFTEDI